MRSSEDIKMLLELAKNGDKDAFATVYEEYFAPVFRYLYFRTGDYETAEDLAQVTFIKSYQRIAQYSQKWPQPLAYFLTIARNTLIDHWRSSKKVLQDEELLNRAESKAPTPHQESETRSDLELVTAQLLDLSPKEQEVVILKYINGLTSREISELINESEAAIRQRQSRAIRTLRIKLKDKI